MNLFGVLKRLFKMAPPPAPTFSDPEAEIAVLEAAHRKTVLNRLAKATFYDENREEWGVRLPDGRVLYRPTHSEIIALWYEDDARSHTPESKPCIKPVPLKGASEIRPQKPHEGRPGRPVEAIDPKTGETRHRFESVAAAGKAGFDRGSIHLVLAGEYRTHGGFLWRYREAAPLQPAEMPAGPSKQTVGSRPDRAQRGISVVASKTPGGPGEHFYVSIAEAARQHQKSYNILWNAVTLGTRAAGYYWRRDDPRIVRSDVP